MYIDIMKTTNRVRQIILLTGYGKLCTRSIRSIIMYCLSLTHTGLMVLDNRLFEFNLHYSELYAFETIKSLIWTKSVLIYILEACLLRGDSE